MEERTVILKSCIASKILDSTKNEDFLENLSQKLEDLIFRFYENDYTVFMSGVQEKFDLMTAVAVLKVRSKHPEIKLIVVIPSMRCTQVGSNVYKWLRNEAVKTILISRCLY